MKVRDLSDYGTACPAQWEGRTDDDRPVYVRYRWGYLSVRVGPPGGDTSSAVTGVEVHGEQVGGEFDGAIEWRQVRDRIKPLRLARVLEELGQRSRDEQ